MSMLQHHSGWVVLPDVPGLKNVVDRFPAQGRIVLRHDSGNPWLVGRFRTDDLVPVALGPVRVALLGSCPIDATRLASIVHGLRSVADLDAVLHRLPGGVHLAASVRGEVRVQGGISGLRQVFHTRIGGVPIAGDRADLLAELAGAGIDEQALALRVAVGPTGPPLDRRTAWSGVRALPPDSYLRLAAERAREVRWWRPPEPDVALRRGARATREALDTAIRSGTGRTGADLSGGMDSTALCFLTARHEPELVTLNRRENDRENGENRFAAECARQLPDGTHLVLDPREIPSAFEDPGALTDHEEPIPLFRELAATGRCAELLAEHGVQRQLAGFGGDEIFGGPPGHLHSLLRQRPVKAIRQLRGYRSLHRWPLLPTMAALLAAHDVAHWWREQSDRLTAPNGPRHHAALDWGPAPLRAAPWASADAVAAARAELRTAATEAEPLATDRGRHQLLTALRTAAPGYRRLVRRYAAAGVRLELPYYDDRVVEAAIAVRPAERASPWRYKPLLAEAARGTAPDAVLQRPVPAPRPDAGVGADVHIGFRRHRGAVLALFTDSELAAHGLVDTGVLRKHLLAPHVEPRTLVALEHLLGCEAWLRGVTQGSTGRTDAPATAS
ncbi:MULTISPECIES: asparagine synthase-related protein [unclassified Saccharopolyspora]|uniref:asparagine synthase-related protein n=1 Tax=unclassified Saccharopolyspora TaxID=2646250 RepID=UPI001CD69D7A|nr:MULTISPECIES: asparagine synthase-related protein [unclassified Saccharopolyspora]MCA1193932.1 asparagine synthase [Saccharopolyspora sp. 6V]MCA1283324.1 asparagine synthase [Saccharopolyspora sp. 7B]